MLDFKFISKGDISTVGVSTRDVLKFALDTSATSIVMAHNHPGGIAVPSTADLDITRAVSKALGAVSIILLDHIILANGDFVSLRQSERYAEVFE